LLLFQIQDTNYM